MLIRALRGIEKLSESGECEWVALRHADNIARICSSR